MGRFKDYVLPPLLGVSIGISTVFGMAAADNYIVHHDYLDYYGASGMVAEKLDGPFSYTSVHVFTDDSILVVQRYKILVPYPFAIYRDTDGDGRVDNMHLRDGFLLLGDLELFTREDDYNAHRDLFELADQELAAQCQRFRVDDRPTSIHKLFNDQVYSSL